MTIKYKKNITTKDIIQILAIRIGKLEVKAINKLVEEMELYKVLERFLTAKEQDVYYKSKFRLKQLLNEKVRIMSKKELSDQEREINEQFGFMTEERRAELRAEFRKGRILTESEVNSDNIDILFTKVKTLESNVKRILEHLGMELIKVSEEETEETEEEGLEFDEAVEVIEKTIDAEEEEEAEEE